MKKEVIILFALFILSTSFVSASFFDKITGRATSNLNCIDSDNGINYAQKGSIRLQNEYSSGEEFDKCTGIGEGISELVCGSDGCGYAVVYPTKERKNPQYMLIYDNGNCDEATATGGYTYDCSVEDKLCSEGKCVEKSVQKCVPDWECSEWTPCQKFRTSSMSFIFQQTRTCEDKNNCATIEAKPDEVQSCSNPCIENWSCSKWSSCTNDKQTRTCEDINKCGTDWDHPTEIKNCDVIVCEDGTANNKCSENKPDFCDSGSLIKNCNICGCNTGFDCIDNSCVKQTYCKSYYGGIEFDGFCFTDFDKTVLENPKAKNGVFEYEPQNSNVQRIFEYPQSIKVKDFGVNFSINFTLKNNGNTEETINLHDFSMFVYNNEKIDFSQEITILPNETKEINIPINLPNTNARIGVNHYINFYDGQDSYMLPRIIFYWDYNPFSEQNVETLKCGNKTYNKNQGVCIDNTFFPSIDGYSCNNDNDCLSYDNETTNFNCYEHSCLVMDGTYNIGSKDKKYKVAILPVYITDSQTEYSKMVGEVNNKISTIIPEMEDWFTNEKVYWNVTNDFGFDYFKASDDCRFNYSEWQQIHPTQGNMAEDELRQIEEKCLSKNDYDILILSIQRDDNFPNFEGAGINYQTIMASALNPRTIIHELLHSFGEHDLYGVEAYQWGNCYLYNVNTGGDWNLNLPHLCNFEAMQIGWIDKSPSSSEVASNNEETESLINCNDGCIVENKCIPISIRSKDSYCSLDKTLEKQKITDEQCENNFECLSNICIDKKCVDTSIWNKFISWFRNIF